MNIIIWHAVKLKLSIVTIVDQIYDLGDLREVLCFRRMWFQRMPYFHQKESSHNAVTGTEYLIQHALFWYGNNYQRAGKYN